MIFINTIKFMPSQIEFIDKIAPFSYSSYKYTQKNGQICGLFQSYFSKMHQIESLNIQKNNNQIMDSSIGNYYLQAQVNQQSFSHSPEVQSAYPHRLNSLQHFQAGTNSTDHPLEQYQKYLSLTLEIPNIPKTQSHPIFSAERSSKSQIMISQSTIKQYQKARRGGKDDTMELNINFKTLIIQYFKQLRLVNELDEYDISKLNDFLKRAPSLKSLMIFLEKVQSNKTILTNYLDFFTSSACIARILLGRGRMRTKVTMIKFIEKMRRNAITINNVGQRWKENTKYLF